MSNTDTQSIGHALQIVRPHCRKIAPSPWQHRRREETDIRELAESLYATGLIHLPTVRRPSSTTLTVYPDAEFELECGHRRLRAIRQLYAEGRTHEEDPRSAVSCFVPVVVRDGHPPSETVVRALVENLQRQALGPYEEALAIMQVRKMLAKDGTPPSTQRVADHLGIPKTRAFEGMQIAKAITLDELRQAGLVSGKEVDWTRVAQLRKTDLIEAAQGTTRAAVVRRLVQCQSADTVPADAGPRAGNRPTRFRNRSTTNPTVGGDPTAEYERILREGGYRGPRFTQRPHEMSVKEAKQKFEALLPAVAVLAERAGLLTATTSFGVGPVLLTIQAVERDAPDG